MYINVHTISGNLGGDAILRDAGTNKVVSFRMANSSPFKDGTTTWYNVSLFGKQAEALASMLTKGKQVIVSGETSQDEYTTKSGEKRTAIKIRANTVQLVGSRADAENESEEVEEGLDDLF